MSVRSIGPAAIKSVLQKIKDGQYYDGSQMGITLINRCVSRGLDSEAVRLCFLFGMEMVKANQFDLSSSLGILMIKIFTEFELEVTDERIQMILDLFTPTPPNPSEERSRFIERAIKWASMDSGAESHLRTLHAAAGKAYQESGQFGQAQGHLVYCGDADALALLLKEWRQKGYPSEQELFVLRLILILLAKGDVSVAKSVLESNGMTVGDWWLYSYGKFILIIGDQYIRFCIYVGYR